MEEEEMILLTLLVLRWILAVCVNWVNTRVWEK